MAIKTIKSMMSTEFSVDFECERSFQFSLKGSMKHPAFKRTRTDDSVIATSLTTINFRKVSIEKCMYALIFKKKKKLLCFQDAMFL